MRRFNLVRDVDVSGVSGTGVVVEGVQFTDGTVAIRWLGETPSTVVWGSIEHAMKIHGHGGATRVEWVDEEYLDVSPHAEGIHLYHVVERVLFADDAPSNKAMLAELVVDAILADRDVSPRPFRHPIAEHVVELDRRDHPEDYVETVAESTAIVDDNLRAMGSAGLSSPCDCEGEVHVCE